MEECWIPFDFKNLVKSAEVNCDLLPVTIFSGIPCIANNCRNTEMVLTVEICGIYTTSAHLEWESTTKKRNFSENGTEKSQVDPLPGAARPYSGMQRCTGRCLFYCWAGFYKAL